MDTVSSTSGTGKTRLVLLLLLSRFSRVQLCATLWTIAGQPPQPTGFFRQEYWSGLPFPPAGALPDSGIEPTSFMPTCTGRWVLYH